ncbi:DoxX family protein [Kribbella sp. CA-247076]|uniref:DoxX family protein n=1 Tax=Kribbella sp. CA-247076 TaxID=3239941 RepID=UPI003D8B7976
MIDPWWPLATLAFVQFGDAVLCYKPVAFVRNCLTNVRFPQRFWPVLTPLKLAAAAGLIIGIWVTWLAVLTAAALVGYFLVAIGAHLRARDFGRDLFVNATGMLALCVATLVFVLAAA